MTDNIITDSAILDDLYTLFNSWTNVVHYEYIDQNRFCQEFEIVIKASNGKHYRAIVYDDGEACCTEFEDTEWTEVTLKQVLVDQWIDV